MTRAGLVFITVCIVLGIWDAIALTFGLESTVSWWIRDLSFKAPIVPFTLGIFAGRAFGAMKVYRAKASKTTGVVVMLVCLALSVYEGFCITLGYGGVSLWLMDIGTRSPIVPFVLGVLVGHFFCYVRPVSE